VGWREFSSRTSPAYSRLRHADGRR
jgi:hypothetical protein